MERITKILTTGKIARSSNNIISPISFGRPYPKKRLEITMYITARKAKFKAIATYFANFINFIVPPIH